MPSRTRTSSGTSRSVRQTDPLLSLDPAQNTLISPDRKLAPREHNSYSWPLGLATSSAYSTADNELHYVLPKSHLQWFLQTSLLPLTAPGPTQENLCGRNPGSHCREGPRLENATLTPIIPTAWWSLTSCYIQNSGKSKPLVLRGTAW